MKYLVTIYLDMLTFRKGMFIVAEITLEADESSFFHPESLDVVNFELVDCEGEKLEFGTLYLAYQIKKTIYQWVVEKQLFLSHLMRVKFAKESVC